MQIVACRWELRRNYFYLTAWRQPNPRPIFHPPLQVSWKVHWIKMILMLNHPLACFWSLFYAYIPSSKHKLSTISATMKEDEKKPTPTDHLLRSGRPPVPHKKCFPCAFITIRLSNIQIPYIRLGICMEYCMWPSKGQKLLRSLNGLLWFVPLVCSNG